MTHDLDSGTAAGSAASGSLGVFGKWGRDVAEAIPGGVWGIFKLPFLLIGSLGALFLVLGLASSANATLTAGFSVSKNSTLVAPASVYVKAISADPNDPNVSTIDSDSSIRERRDLKYEWFFGDDPNATWSMGIQPGVDLKSYHCCSPDMLHVYESGGTFTIKLRVTDRKNALVVETTRSVTVESGDDHWNDTNDPNKTTICVNPAGISDWTGCPSPNLQRTIGTDGGYDDWDDAVNTTLSHGNRILFHGGQTFYANLTRTITRAAGSPAKLIGCFGTCTGPEGASPVSVAVTAQTVFTCGSGGTFNTRLVDHDFQYVGAHTTSYGRGWDCQNPRTGDILLLRVGFTEFGTDFYMEFSKSSNDPNADVRNAIIDSYVGPITDPNGPNGAAGWGMQFSCFDCAVLGTHFSDSIYSHQIRSSVGFGRLFVTTRSSRPTTVRSQAVAMH